MFKIKKYGLFFIIILFSSPQYAFSEQDLSLDLEPIVITKSGTHLFNNYNLEYDTLGDLPFNSPLEALSILPLDLQSRSLKGDIQTDFSLRGSNFQGVLFLINNQRINDPQTAHHNSDIPITKEDIERIEVIPGAASSLFGPDAIGGAINVILKKPKEKNMVLELSGGSYQTKSGLLSISDKTNKMGLRFSLENQESSGFYEDTDFKKFTTALNSSLDIPSGEFNINLGYQEKEFGAYDFYTPALGYLSKEWTKTYLLNTGLNLENQAFIIKPNFLWRRHYDKFMLDKTQRRSQYLNHHRTDIYTPSIYFQKETDLLGNIGVGLECGEEDINSTNLGKHKRHHKSIFLDNSQDLTAKFSLGTSLRSDDFDGFDRAYTGSTNLKFKISQQDILHLGISRSIRIPSFTELYYNDPTTVGDAGLSDEGSLNYEAGFNYKRERVSFGTGIFLRNEKDFIDWIKRSSSQAKWQAENITEADVFGIEEHLKLKMSQNLTLDSNYTYVNKRIDDHGYLYKYGPNYTRHLINTNLSFNLPFGEQTIGFCYKKKPSRDGWFLLNVALSCNLNPARNTGSKDAQGKISNGTKIFLKVTNLLNVEYQEIEGIPQPGRFIEAGIRLDW